MFNVIFAVLFATLVAPVGCSAREKKVSEREEPLGKKVKTAPQKESGAKRQPNKEDTAERIINQVEKELREKTGSSESPYGYGPQTLSRSDTFYQILEHPCDYMDDFISYVRSKTNISPKVGSILAYSMSNLPVDAYVGWMAEWISAFKKKSIDLKMLKHVVFGTPEYIYGIYRGCNERTVQDFCKNLKKDREFMDKLGKKEAEKYRKKIDSFIVGDCRETVYKKAVEDCFLPPINDPAGKHCPGVAEKKLKDEEIPKAWKKSCFGED